MDRLDQERYTQKEETTGLFHSDVSKGKQWHTKTASSTSTQVCLYPCTVCYQKRRKTEEGREGGRVAYGKTNRKGQKWRHNVVECLCVQGTFKMKTARQSVKGRCRLAHADSSRSLLHPSVYTYFAYIMDVVIIPACRHVAYASLLPLSKKAGTTGTQPDYPINLL